MPDDPVGLVEQASGIVLSNAERYGIMGLFVTMFFFVVVLGAWLIVTSHRRYERVVTANSLTEKDAEANRQALKDIMQRFRISCEAQESYWQQMGPMLRTLGQALEQHTSATFRTEIASINAEIDLIQERQKEQRAAMRHDTKSITDSINSMHQRLDRDLEQRASEQQNRTNG